MCVLASEKVELRIDTKGGVWTRDAVYGTDERVIKQIRKEEIRIEPLTISRDLP